MGVAVGVSVTVSDILTQYTYNAKTNIESIHAYEHVHSQNHPPTETGMYTKTHIRLAPI